MVLGLEQAVGGSPFLSAERHRSSSAADQTCGSSGVGYGRAPAWRWTGMLRHAFRRARARMQHDLRDHGVGAGVCVDVARAGADERRRERCGAGIVMGLVVARAVAKVDVELDGGLRAVRVDAELEAFTVVQITGKSLDVDVVVSGRALHPAGQPPGLPAANSTGRPAAAVRKAALEGTSPMTVPDVPSSPEEPSASVPPTSFWSWSAAWVAAQQGPPSSLCLLPARPPGSCSSPRPPMLPRGPIVRPCSPRWGSHG